MFPADWVWVRLRLIRKMPSCVQISKALRREAVSRVLHQLWSDERGQDVAEYAVMLAVVLVIVVGTIRLMGVGANNAFSQVASAITQ